MLNLSKKFKDLFLSARTKISIFGVNSLIPDLGKSAEFFSDLLILNTNLTLSIYYESDSEIFNQSLCTDTITSSNRYSFAKLIVHRDRISGTKKNGGLLRDIADFILDDEQKRQVVSRIKLRQVNLRMPINSIIVDDKLSFTIITNSIPTIDDYMVLDPNDALYVKLKDMINFYVSTKDGSKYLSEPEEELIQLYDKKSIPRGIYPRSCFYTTEYQRYSIWGFIFNRKGELLLQQRSLTTQDGRGLWDKSVGGHVDLNDSSTFITAQRELVEELFLPEAEYSKYISADLGDIINFGDWNSKKRPERVFKNAFSGLDKADWIQFRATGDNGAPLTITRDSNRRIHNKDGTITIKRTMFRSDVYLFIAPVGYLDTTLQMKKLLEVGEEKGASSDHRLVSVSELREWVNSKEEEGCADEFFTDDLLYINTHFRGLLEEFAEFLNYIE